MGLFDDILGGIHKSTDPKPDPRIAFEVWCEKQPFFQKIPKEDDATIKIKVSDFKRIAAAAYSAGFYRAK